MADFINTVDTIGDEGLMDLLLTKELTELYDNYITVLGRYALYSQTLLAVVDVPNCTEIKNYALHTSGVSVLVLRSDRVVTLENINVFIETPIASGTGYIYVPSALIEEYKIATNWTTYADQFRALEDYTVDGTITGELDESKI